LPAVRVSDLANIRRVGKRFVGQEIVFKAFENAFREFRDLAVLFENFDALEHCNDLIVSFIIVDEAEPADRPRL
jgi:hypothetical protein